MTYYFGVKATEKHDPELEIIEADTLEEAKREFAGMHPEDVENIEYINEENSIVDIK